MRCPPGQVSFFNSPVRLSVGETLLEIEINVDMPTLGARPASGVGLSDSSDFDLALGDADMAAEDESGSQVVALENEEEDMGTAAPFRPEAEPAASLMEAMPVEAMPVEAVPIEVEPWPPAAETTDGIASDHRGGDADLPAPHGKCRQLLVHGLPAKLQNAGLFPLRAVAATVCRAADGHAF